MKINVVNREGRVKQPNDYYIGRGSKLGNPFTHLPLEGTKAQYHVESREEAVSEYEKWIEEKIAEKDDKVLRGLEEIKKVLAEYGEVNLVCYCAPQSCHGDILKKILSQTGTESQKETSSIDEIRENSEKSQGSAWHPV
jgi:hypothetical protein